MSDHDSTSAATAAPQKKPRRRWLQFSLRTLLLVMVPVACVAAWLGAEYQKGRRQKEAIAWVEAQGGLIEYDTEATENDWRRRWFGGWIPKRVKGVYFCDQEVRLTFSPYPPVYDTGISDLAPLTDLPDIQSLAIDPSQITDLSPLAELKQLRELTIRNSPVKKLAPLERLKYLEILSLEDTLVCDLAPLSNLENLEVLCLKGSHITDISPLFDLNRLRMLTLLHTQVSYEQVQAFRIAMPDCEIHLGIKPFPYPSSSDLGQR